MRQRKSGDQVVTSSDGKPAPASHPTAHLWRPGVSGNPGGQPKGFRAARRKVAEALDKRFTTQEGRDLLIEALVEGVANGDPSLIKLAAEYRWGKPAVEVEFGDDDHVALALATLRRSSTGPDLLILAEAVAAGMASVGREPEVREVREVRALPFGGSPVTLPDLTVSSQAVRVDEPASSDRVRDVVAAPAWWPAILARYARVAIAGGPRTGKTTLSASDPTTGHRVYRGDDHVHLGWSESSAALVSAVNSFSGPLIVEGVQVPRALRKGLRVDAVVWLDTPHVPLTPEQMAMAKGCRTVMDEWEAANALLGSPVAVIRPPT